MKWVRTIILFDEGQIASSQDWRAVHAAYVRAIKSIDHPAGSGSLTIRKKVKLANGQWSRNGVGYLRKRFLNQLVNVEGWRPETSVGIVHSLNPAHLHLYPSLRPHIEPVTSDFGGFDFEMKSRAGLRIAIEWETGNISSSHRSMNKLAIALGEGTIQIGVLIVPSRALYEHLTDRIGNISELAGYLRLWQSMRSTVKKGLLAISIVQHDKLSNASDIPYLASGADGRSLKRRSGNASKSLLSIKRKKL